MAWCRQATSHYLSQCWPRSLLPYVITRPQYFGFHCHISVLCIHSVSDNIINLSVVYSPHGNAQPTFQFTPYWSTGIFNSLAPGKFEWNFRHVIFKQILVIDDWGISCEIALTWKPQDLTDDKSTLVQVMACCLTALSQCWPSSLPPYGITRPQWVNWSHRVTPATPVVISYTVRCH